MITPVLVALGLMLQVVKVVLMAGAMVAYVSFKVMHRTTGIMGTFHPRW